MIQIVLKGRLPNCIKNYLSGRTFKVQVGSISDAKIQEVGSHRGILSTTLFNIKINRIINCLNPEVDGSQYVDDFLVSKNIHTI